MGQPTPVRRGCQSFVPIVNFFSKQPLHSTGQIPRWARWLRSNEIVMPALLWLNAQPRTLLFSVLIQFLYSTRANKIPSWLGSNQIAIRQGGLKTSFNSSTLAELNGFIYAFGGPNGFGGGKAYIFL